MKKLGIYSMAFLMLGIGTMSTGCFGSFALVGKVYKWNKGLGNKWMQSIVMWGLFIIPVYEFCGFVDIVILNLVEFWTGSNPVAMGPKDKESQVVMGKDGNSYEITATQNRFEVIQLSGDNKGTKQVMLFNPEAKSCSLVIDGKESKLVQYDEASNMVELFRPDGSSIQVDANADQTMALEQLMPTSTFALAK